MVCHVFETLCVVSSYTITNLESEKTAHADRRKMFYMFVLMCSVVVLDIHEGTSSSSIHNFFSCFMESVF